MDKSVVFEVDNKPGWKITLTYVDDKKVPDISGTDENGKPLSPDTLESMKLFIRTEEDD
jgi:hypothetical protein